MGNVFFQRLSNYCIRQFRAVFIYLATRTRFGKIRVLLWKLAGLHFNGREIRYGCFFDTPSKVFVGENTFLNYENYFHISNGDATITIGRDCDIAPQCMFMCTTHSLGGQERRAGKLSFLPIVIGNGCWIGTRALILPGVTIGDGCLVAAGSVVTKSFPSNVMVGGVPAEIIKRLE
jgi:acetyltransferase-like isoleucine patch superfamily enzyme